MANRIVRKYLVLQRYDVVNGAWLADHVTHCQDHEQLTELVELLNMQVPQEIEYFINEEQTDA